ncbi:hypothetical protein CHS0354_013527 [Potamilus streckersoni]|uniref:Uncharacterized protein n=1 Tax=Potamilus streckersoni TaxID=2493646 RepID=A0AAE0W886_9BIVA|nr:hypothetical protein CHS0354_013527 [Potamilus streckersoni]
MLTYEIKRKVNGLLMKFRQTRDKGPDQSNPVYGVNGPAFENTNLDKFDNLTYAMQTGQEYMQPGSFPTVGYEYSKPVPREKIGGQRNENPSNTGGSSPWSNDHPEYKEVNVKEPYDTTYQTLSDEHHNTSYDHIMGSNPPTLITPKAKLGGTAYDNAAI